MKVVIIAGATGSGKSSLSLKLASKFNGTIINADASQFRKGLDIGTAKVSEAEKKMVKHEMLDIICPMDLYSIKDYQEEARRLLSNTSSNCFIVGGSGLYIDALMLDYDLDDTSKVDEKKYEAYSNEELYKMLEESNNELAMKTHMNNRRRVIRYLEVNKVPTKKPIPLYDCLYIYVNKDREKLYQDINNRTIKMFSDGWIDEAIGLKENGVDLKSIKEIGYSMIDDYINGLIKKEDLISLIQQKTRNYAKRQITWFNKSIKNYDNVIFYDTYEDDYNVLEEKVSKFFNE